MELLQERSYFIQRTMEGVFVIYIKARPTEAKGATMHYDGGDNALFMRRPLETLVLDYINPAVHQDLLKADRVIVVEIELNDQQAVRDYKVPVIQVPKITIYEKK